MAVISGNQIIQNTDYLDVLHDPEHVFLKSIRSLAHKALITALRDARKQAGLSQQEVARRLRRPQSFVSAYESGDRKIDVLEFLRIAKVTGSDPCELLRRVI
jgi:DNA-binding transcriptional regulator YiaG